METTISRAERQVAVAAKLNSGESRKNVIKWYMKEFGLSKGSFSTDVTMIRKSELGLIKKAADNVLKQHHATVNGKTYTKEDMIKFGKFVITGRTETDDYEGDLELSMFETKFKRK